MEVKSARGYVETTREIRPATIAAAALLEVMSIGSVVRRHEFAVVARVRSPHTP